MEYYVDGPNAIQAFPDGTIRVQIVSGGRKATLILTYNDAQRMVTKSVAASVRKDG